MSHSRAAIVVVSAFAAASVAGIGHPAPLMAGPLCFWRGADMRPVAAAPAFHAKGMLVERLERGSPAARAGLKPGDVIAALDGMPVGTVRNLAMAIADHCCGPTVTLRVWRDQRDRMVKLPPSSALPTRARRSHS